MDINRPAPRFETAFAVNFSSIVYGPGAAREVGDHALDLGLRRVLVLTDHRVRDLPVTTVVVQALAQAGIEADVYDGVEVEPTDASFQAAAEVAGAGHYDGFVAVGGGSTIDTAKAANLYATYPAPFLDYVNPPIGRGLPPPGPLRPLIAIPTTAGTGSETTGVAIFDFRELRAKTGIAHRRLRPTLGIVDPDLLATLPASVAACAGFDVLCHALESLTARPYRDRPAPERPLDRPAYQGSNPFSDVWAEQAIRLVSRALPRLVADRSDAEAREAMALASTYAGVGFGNAGVHLPHGMSYAVSGLVREFRAPGYPEDRPLIPHGMSVVLCAPAVFRWTAAASGHRHLWAAELLGADTTGVAPVDAGELIAEQLISLMRRVGMPSGLGDVGYGPSDLDALVEATLPQHRVTKLSPRAVERADLERLFASAMRYW